MDVSNNLAYDSDFNYQKIIDENSVNVTIPASILSPTVVATIPTQVAAPKQFRLRVQYNGKRTTLSRVDLVGHGASLYAYASGSNIIVECDNSAGSPVDVIISYRVYADVA